MIYDYDCTHIRTIRYSFVASPHLACITHDTVECCDNRDGKKTFMSEQFLKILLPLFKSTCQCICERINCNVSVYTCNLYALFLMFLSCLFEKIRRFLF